MKEESPVASAVGFASGGAFGILSCWWTFVAFFGGTMPLIGLKTSGGLLFGLFWLCVIQPALITAFFGVLSAIAFLFTKQR